MAELSDQEMLRYNRQIILRGFDFEGQEALKDCAGISGRAGRARLRGNAVSGWRWRRATDATRF
ncbi:molybdopterin biosynthesis MoeB protein [Salmonella enterica subsp. enterica serovar Typhimurium]|nr:molybdopterin biosynthesis MoeB protein [Salmonella enterica subsp. enterica serovar Typhimurium]